MRTSGASSSPTGSGTPRGRTGRLLGKADGPQPAGGPGHPPPRQRARGTGKRAARHEGQGVSQPRRVRVTVTAIWSVSNRRPTPGEGVHQAGRAGHDGGERQAHGGGHGGRAMSPRRTWVSSWARTASSDTGSRARSSPEVTTMVAAPLRRPTARASRAASSTTARSGAARPMLAHSPSTRFSARAISSSPGARAPRAAAAGRWRPTTALGPWLRPPAPRRPPPPRRARAPSGRRPPPRGPRWPGARTVPAPAGGCVGRRPRARRSGRTTAGTASTTVTGGCRCPRPPPPVPAPPDAPLRPVPPEGPGCLAGARPRAAPRVRSHLVPHPLAHHLVRSPHARHPPRPAPPGAAPGAPPPPPPGTTSAPGTTSSGAAGRGPARGDVGGAPGRRPTRSAAPEPRASASMCSCLIQVRQGEPQLDSSR